MDGLIRCPDCNGKLVTDFDVDQGPFIRCLDCDKCFPPPATSPSGGFDAAARQPKSHGIEVDLCTLVKQDLERRMEVGQKKYGERLRPFNGRDALLDLYQEVLDAAMYCRQMLYERDAR
jgi:hypothetical protein